MWGSAVELMKRLGSLTFSFPRVACVYVVFVKGAVSLLTALKYIAGCFHLEIYLQISVYIQYIGVIKNKKVFFLHRFCIFPGHLELPLPALVHSVMLQIHWKRFLADHFWIMLHYFVYLLFLCALSIFRPIIQQFLIFDWVAMPGEQERKGHSFRRFSPAAFWTCPVFSPLFFFTVCSIWNAPCYVLHSWKHLAAFNITSKDGVSNRIPHVPVL